MTFYKRMKDLREDKDLFQIVFDILSTPNIYFNSNITLFDIKINSMI